VRRAGRSTGSTNSHCSSVSSQRPAIDVRGLDQSNFSLAEKQHENVYEMGPRLYSVDLHPRAEIDSLCDKVIRQPLERSDLSFINDLGAGDILFIDSSHRCFMNSDVTVLFLDVLPKLRRGVAVHIHDIYLPLDYPQERAHWFHSEQYCSQRVF
jgi:hypothetical protein